MRVSGFCDDLQDPVRFQNLFTDWFRLFNGMSEKQDVEECELYTLPDDVSEKIQAVVSEDMAEMVCLFKMLSDPVRLRILKALEVQDLCVCILAGITDYRYSALSYHLKLLKDADLVDSRRDKSFQIYSLTGFGRSLLGSVKNAFQT